MKDIPLFTTPYGTASLLLKEIPYRQTAYIRLLAVEKGHMEDLLRECVSFCRMAGAEHVYATGDPALESYPLYTAVLEMRAPAAVDPSLLANLFPVTEETVSRWREIYNERMRSVDNAGSLTAYDEKQILASGGAYFIHREGKLLGIGWMEDTRLLAVAAVEPGMGKTVMNSLLSLVEGADVTLEVASTNEKAIRLYRKLGFVPVKEISRWHRIR